jgi:hypothetical protein
MVIDTLAMTVLSASRKGLFRQRPIFRAHAKLSSGELPALEERIRVALPGDLRDWLLTVGYGDLDEQLSFRDEWFAPIESGQLAGGAIFAQDILGNFYAFDRSLAQVYYLSRSERAFALIASSFLEFMKELVHRDYKLVDWTNTLKTTRYDW